MYIKLDSDSLRSRNFLWLCTGQQGPSFCNSRFFEVGFRGQRGEYIRGGDYEDNSGQAGAALLPGLGDIPCKNKMAREGMVNARYAGDATASQFYIMTTDADWPLMRTFGEVERGLEIVKAAAQWSDIKDVSIVDCGVVLLF